MRTQLALCGALAIAIVSAGTLALGDSAPTPSSSISLTSNAFPGKVYSLKIIQDDQGAIQEMDYDTDNGSKTVPLGDLEKNPQVLFAKDGNNVITLSIDSDFTAEKGGHLELQFLENGLTGNVEDFRILADVQTDGVVLRSDPNPSDPHSDKNSYTSVFNALYFKAGTLGVSDVIPSEVAPSPIPSKAT